MCQSRAEVTPRPVDIGHIREARKRGNCCKYRCLAAGSPPGRVPRTVSQPASLPPLT
jgi:hypothetical protein